MDRQDSLVLEVSLESFWSAPLPARAIFFPPLMKKSHSTAAIAPPAEDGQAAVSPAPSKRKAKSVDYKIKLADAEDKQLTALRDACRLSGLRASKGKLLRAAVVFLGRQTPADIEGLLTQLEPLKTKRTG